MSGNDVVTYIAQHSNLYREWEIRFEYIKIALIAFSARSYSALCMCVGEVQMGCRENLIITDTVLWELSTLYDFVSGCKRVDFFLSNIRMSLQVEKGLVCTWKMSVLISCNCM